MSKWPIVRLGDVCMIRPPKREVRDRLNDRDRVTFLPMEDLPVRGGLVSGAKTKSFGDAYPSYTYFADGDVLLAKITPCFENGKIGIADNLVNGVGFGSSEFMVLRCTALILPEYLYHFLSQESLVEAGMPNMKGSVGHRRIPQDFIENLELPLPPLDEQKRIVAKLDLTQTDVSRLTQVVDARENKVGSLSTQLIDSQYLRLPESVPTLQLGEVAEIRGGKRLPRGTGLTDIDTGFRYVTVSDFNSDGSVDWRSVRFITAEQREQISRYTISNADVYVSIAGTIGKTGVIPIELEGANLTENACKLVLGDRVDRDYIFWYTRTSMFSSQAVDRTRVSAQPKLALERLKTLQLPVPAISEQRRIARTCSKIASAATDYSALCSQQQELIHLFRGLSMNEILSGAA